MSDDDVEISFPLEFAVQGTPVSSQTKTGKSRDRWKQEVVDALGAVLPEYKWASDKPLSLTIYDFPTDLPEGDVDNIVKYIQDAINKRVYVDDNLVRRVVAQRFLPEDIDVLDDVPELMARALVNDPPFVYIRVNDDPLGEAK